MTEPLETWRRALAEAWGIDGSLEQLDGEYDLNLRVTARDGRRFVLKVMRPGCDRTFVDMLRAVHQHLRVRNPALPTGEVVLTRDGAPWVTWRDGSGQERILWMLTFLEGDVYARVRPHPLSMLRDFGAIVARLHGALADFTHSALQRELKWDLMRAEWIADKIHVILDESRRRQVTEILERYTSLLPTLRAERMAVVHNDLNDWNVLLARDDTGTPRCAGIVDFGDMIAGPVVAELAIAGAYLVLDQAHPERALATFIAGYHGVAPLAAHQLDLIWPLLLMRLAVSVTNAAQMQRERPGDSYVTISEEPAWSFLERARSIDERQMQARLRTACGYAVTDAAPQVLEWLNEARGRFAPVMGMDLSELPAGSLGVATALAPRDPTAMTTDEARTLGAAARVGDTWIGSYGEPRAVYTAPAFKLGAHPIADRRSVHLGVDIFLPAGTGVHAPCDGVVDVVEYRPQSLDYGGMVVLRHETPTGVPFWTLYGHLARARVAALSPGQRITRGTCFAQLGIPEENGGWDPHLHFQLALRTDGMSGDWPGVADPDDRAFWMAICPNPAALLNLPDARVAYQPIDEARVRADRHAHFAGNLRLSYREPLLFVRGWRHYLYDEWGRVYLDAYNNVPHVGHSHPRITAVAAEQLARLNTNTRYLHPLHAEFAEALLSRVPKHLTHVFFVNSGSEANELALRLARTHTGGKDMITADHGYHGHTTGAYDISAYKFNRPRGGGRPEWVQVVPVADTYRGEFRGSDAAERYAATVDEAIRRVVQRGGRLAGFIAETFPSVAGQIIPPEGYLRGVYTRVRAAGGVCIADEVQTGLGRLGEWFWGFEQQQADPDIVVLGKPLGNGHPIGAVITTQAIAQSFDNGIEFFSTFGGSTLSCRIGTEVLRIVHDEGLEGHAREVGDHLLGALRELQERHESIGDVRGHGLFVGVDLVRDRATREPATRLASYVVNRLREERILIGTEGPADNVLKIRPPLTVTRADLDWLIVLLDGVLSEWVVQHGTHRG